MKSKFFHSLLALTLALCLFAALPSLAEARYPARGDTVTDDANVLSQTMTRDIASYAEEAESESLWIYYRSWTCPDSSLPVESAGIT